jgi:hypothetical protein
MHILNKKLIDAVAMAAEVVSSRIDCSYVNSLATQIKNSGDATTGVYKLQGSVVPDADVSDDADWSDITDATVNVTTAGTYGFEVAVVAYKWVRAVYTQADGTGTLNAWINGKSS